MRKVGIVDLKAAIAVARRRSFRAASADVGVSATALSQTIAGLEARLGARLFNRTSFGDLSPTAIKHAKMIIASTLASAAPGSHIASARIIRELSIERGGRPEATVWFDAA